MTTSEESLRAATVKSIMSSNSHDREQWMVEKLLDIAETCSKRNCGQTMIQQWTPAAVATAISGSAIAIVEFLRGGK